MKTPQSDSPSAPTPTLCLYFASTPFHYLAACAVKATYYATAEHHLLYTRKEVFHTLGSIPTAPPWDAISYYPWPRLDPLPGRFGRHRRLLANLDQLLLWAEGHTNILVLADQIVSEPVNFSINALRKQGLTVHVQLIPDGYMNFHRVTIPRLELLGQFSRKLRRLSSARLSYTRITGDRTGIDHPSVEYIHLFERTPHEYPAEKVRFLPPMDSLFPSAPAKLLERVLIIGHAKRFDPELARCYATGMQNLLAELGVSADQVDYKGHPKCPHDDFWDERYREINPPEVLELYLLRHRYQAVIAIISSTLFNIRLSQGAAQRCIALGPNRLDYHQDGGYASARVTLDALGIEVIEL